MTNSGRLLAVATIAGWLWGFPSPAKSYDLQTHDALSREAFSQAGVVSRLPSYGLDPTKKIRGLVFSLRQGPRLPVEWIAWGARDEDTPSIRVLTHFYDPHFDRGLTIGELSWTRAPDWALEDRQADLQGYSYRDAREAFYGGLTLVGPGSRERELGHAFYSLGHVIHLIQDLTVPEHARNDAHLTDSPDRSFLEEYLNKNIAKFTPTSQALPPAGMPVVKQARELWVKATGTGIAQFTNANFVSPDTNFREARTGATGGEYPSPVLDLTRVYSGPLGACEDTTQPNPPAPLFFFKNDMPDPVPPDPAKPTLTNPRMTTYSVFDELLKRRRKPLIFSLNCFTVDAAARILLPRAVSYSASLLEYFFRGRPTAIFGDSTFRVGNRTSDARRAEVMDGRFELYRDDGGGQRQLLATWTLRLDPDRASGPLAVPLLPDGDPSRCILVFRGLLGDETDGVAGQQLDRCPTSATLAGPYVEVGLPAAGPGVHSPGCPDGFWLYLVQLCCNPGSDPGYLWYCAPSPQGAVIACENSTPWWYVCSLA